jgi:hypothetical protein
MAASLLLLAIIGGIVVGDLVLENTTASDITMLHHTITGHSEGLLLATAAALGVVVGLLVVASASTTRTRRARRQQLRIARRDLTRQVAEFERENARLRKELACRDRPVRHHDEVTSPAHLGSTASAASTAERRVTDASQRAERRSEPLYEETRRAAHLRSDPELSFLFTDEYARQWQTHERVRRS